MTKISDEMEGGKPTAFEVLGPYVKLVKVTAALISTFRGIKNGHEERTRDVDTQYTRNAQAFDRVFIVNDRILPTIEIYNFPESSIRRGYLFYSNLNSLAITSAFPS